MHVVVLQDLGEILCPGGGEVDQPASDVRASVGVSVELHKTITASWSASMSSTARAARPQAPSPGRTGHRTHVSRRLQMPTLPWTAPKPPPRPLDSPATVMASRLELRR